MNRWQAVVFAAVVLMGVASCSTRHPAGDTGTNSPDSTEVDIATPLDTKPLPDAAIPPDTLIIPDFGSTSPKWSVSAGGTQDDHGNSIAVDSSGNSYITGSFKGTATFGSTILTTKGKEDIFVAKVDLGGKFLWAVAAGGPKVDVSYSIAVDSSGTSYVTGSFESIAAFGNIDLTSQGDTDIFVAKVDSSGKFVWAISAGGKSSIQSNSIAVDGSGNSYITGYYQGNVTIGNIALTSKGSLGFRDIFIAKVNGNGKVLWAISNGGYSAGNSIVVDNKGNSFVVGYFLGTVTFAKTTLISKGILDIFVAKVGNGGKILWVATAGGTKSDSGYSIALDSSGNSYITGYFSGTATFGSTTLIFYGGPWSGNIFVAKLDTGGKFVSAVTASGSSNAAGYSIAVSSSGGSYVAGCYEGAATFGSTTLSATPYNKNLFVAKVDSSGKFLGAISAGGTGDVGGNSIAVDGSGNSYITGDFKGTATFGTTTLTSKGDSDIFVAKLDKNGKF